MFLNIHNWVNTALIVLIGLLVLVGGNQSADQAQNYGAQSHTNSGLVVNEDGTDDDSRIESDSNTHMFFVDAGNNRIGINDSSPDVTLDIDTSNTATSSVAVGCVQTTATSTDTPIRFLIGSIASTSASHTGNNSVGHVMWGYGTCPI